MPARRPLMFDRLEEIMPEVDRLLAGHETVGNWSLGQICNHLAESFRCSIENYSMHAPWLVRATIGRLVKRPVLVGGRIREGVKAPEAFLPKPGLDARAEAEALRASVAYYQRHDGPRPIHPFFGRLSPAEWDRFHCVHAAHHLSFALPKAAAAV